MQTYKAAVVGCSRIGAFIDNEHQNRPDIPLPSSHSAGYEACERTNLVAGADLREDVLEMFGNRYDVPASRRYTDYKAMIEREKPDILSVARSEEHTSELQSRLHLVCRLLLEKKKRRCGWPTSCART